MRLFKLIVTLVILGLIGLFVFENMATWTSLVSFKFELPLLGKSEPKLELYLLMLLCMIVGFVVGIGALLKPYLNARRTLVRERKDKETGAVQLKESEAQAS